MATLIKSKTSLWRVYKSEAARKSALTQMVNKGWKYNYFVLYTDVKGPAINAARVTWLNEGRVHIDG
jgi:hypothetical protein